MVFLCWLHYASKLWFNPTRGQKNFNVQIRFPWCRLQPDNTKSVRPDVNQRLLKQGKSLPMSTKVKELFGNLDVYAIQSIPVQARVDHMGLGKLCLLGNFSCFIKFCGLLMFFLCFFSVFFFQNHFFEKLFQENPPECQTVWIQIRTD